jgi:cell filamentation protein
MKYSGDSDDPYLDQETGILRNLLGIKEQLALERLESNFSFLRSAQLLELNTNGNFDLIHLQSIHRLLFGDIYDWAGESRQVEIQKGKTNFARWMMIDTAAKDLFQRLANENFLMNLGAIEFADRAGFYLGEINVLHPFREGNGRTQREFIGLLARKNKLTLDWTGVTREEMINASIHAYNGNHQAMASLVLRSIK